jgi:AraC family transcriptional regulator, regulatory protein of adaptative response / DNA-3-methyladenine glycosylase II
MTLDPDACFRALSTRDARFDGRFFVGVTSTGIYCRPICPSRTPRRSHVEFFPSAAAAQAGGFRPCLRCRPETAPSTPAWAGTATTVARALSLIDLGALDDGNVAALADRLGVGDRQLRRLFLQHVGATPIAVAQARRVLLAKQLLHETALPMADVAMASGFSSIRRFNEVFHALFGTAPSRVRRGATPATAKDDAPEAITVLLRYRPPFDWASIYSFLATRAIPGVELADGTSYARTVSMAGQHGWVSVQPAGGHTLRATIHVRAVDGLPGIVARIRRLFDLGADPQAIGAHLSADPLLAPLVAARPGLRVPGAWDGFEIATRAILGQQVSVAAAVKLAEQLVRHHGEPVSGIAAGVQGLTHSFPAAAALMAAELPELKMPGQRKQAIRLLAAAAAADPAVLDPGPDLDGAVARLKSLPGIGEWTAQYIAMRQLREPDAFPAGDAGLLRAVERLEGCRPSPAALLARAERWRPWRAYAALHLWASLG